MRLRTSPAELVRQNGVATEAPDEAAQQAANERDRVLREEDELLGERARQDWQGVSPWTVVAAASKLTCGRSPISPLALPWLRQEAAGYLIADRFVVRFGQHSSAAARTNRGGASMSGYTCKYCGYQARGARRSNALRDLVDHAKQTGHSRKNIRAG